MPPAALLFDLDGTLVHSDPLHYQAFRSVLAGHAIDLSEADYRARIAGRHNEEIVADLLPHLGRDAGMAVADAKEERFRAQAGSLQPLAGAGALLRSARGAGLALALVTNAPRANAEAVLRAFAWLDVFDVVVSGEEAAAAKPDPAPYLEALTTLGVTPVRSLAFEDSASGVRSARAARLEVVGVVGSADAEALQRFGARWTVADLRPETLAASTAAARLKELGVPLPAG